MAAILLTAACNGDAEPDGDEPWVSLVTFDSASAVVVTATDTLPLRLEVAARDDQRAYGLMERPHLDEDAGMIFVYDGEQPADAGFWMYRTRIPLDIAYLGEDGTILSIVAMDPCASADPRGCRSYPPGVGYHSALEVNRGWFARHNVAVGDRVVLQQ